MIPTCRRCRPLPTPAAARCAPARPRRFEGCTSYCLAISDKRRPRQEPMAETSIRERLEQQAGKALLQNAFFRWESAAIIGGTILLGAFVHPFPGAPRG